MHCEKSTLAEGHAGLQLLEQTLGEAGLRMSSLSGMALIGPRLREKDVDPLDEVGVWRHFLYESGIDPWLLVYIDDIMKLPEGKDAIFQRRRPAARRKETVHGRIVSSSLKSYVLRRAATDNDAMRRAPTITVASPTLPVVNHRNVTVPPEEPVRMLWQDVLPD